MKNERKRSFLHPSSFILSKSFLHSLLDGSRQQAHLLITRLQLDADFQRAGVALGSADRRLDRHLVLVNLVIAQNRILDQVARWVVDVELPWLTLAGDADRGLDGFQIFQ